MSEHDTGSPIHHPSWRWLRDWIDERIGGEKPVYPEAASGIEEPPHEEPAPEGAEVAEVPPAEAGDAAAPEGAAVAPPAAEGVAT